MMVVYFSFVFCFSDDLVMRQAAGGCKQFASSAFVGDIGEREQIEVSFRRL